MTLQMTLANPNCSNGTLYFIKQKHTHQLEMGAGPKTNQIRKIYIYKICTPKLQNNIKRLIAFHKTCDVSSTQVWWKAFCADLVYIMCPKTTKFFGIKAVSHQYAPLFCIKNGHLWLKPCPAKTQLMPNYNSQREISRWQREQRGSANQRTNLEYTYRDIHSPVLWQGAPRNARSGRSAARCTLRFQREQCFLFYTARFLVWFLRKERKREMKICVTMCNR